MVNSTTVFGSSLLLSVLPFIIVLSSLANQRVDDDLSRHIGLDAQGAHVVRTLFRNTPAHAPGTIAIALILGFLGTVATVDCVQVIYERAFALEHRGWRDTPRYVVWVAVLMSALVLEGAVGTPVRTAAGPAVQVLMSFALLAVFFAWTMHFLVAGRVPWRAVVRPALFTAVLWLVLALFSSLSFSSTVVSDSKLYGTIGVVFTILTWFVLVGTVMVLGAAAGTARRRQLQPIVHDAVAAADGSEPERGQY